MHLDTLSRAMGDIMRNVPMSEWARTTLTPLPCWAICDSDGGAASKIARCQHVGERIPSIGVSRNNEVEIVAKCDVNSARQPRGEVGVGEHDAIYSESASADNYSKGVACLAEPSPISSTPPECTTSPDRTV